MSAAALPHGLHRNVPEATYHERVRGCASKHTLDLIHAAPARYQAWLQAEDEPPTPAMVFGRAFHTACLEPHLYEPDLATKRGREDHDRITGMVAAVRRHPIAGRLLSLGHPEVTARWADPDTGLECKGRADLWIAELGTLVDLKSCADASPEEFSRSVARYAYHAQDAFYRDGFARASGAHVDGFVFVAVEKAPPYLVAVYSLDEAAVYLGAKRNARAMQRFRQCLEADDWPGYAPSIQEIQLPRWAQD